MSKELEAIQVLKANTILFDDGSDYGASMLEAIEVLDEYLTPPTEQEVCEALSEYLGVCVRFNQNNNIFEKYVGDGFWKKIDLLRYRNSAPHLVEMIGKFYKGKVKE